MPSQIGDSERAALIAYSRGELGALELRRRLGDATYGDVLRLLGEENLALPRAPTAGREERLALARERLFPSHGKAVPGARGGESKTEP